LEDGFSDEEICRKAKEAASFAGTMRIHLIDMLNALELHRHLNIASCGQLFQEYRELLHTTSLLRFPVFVSKKNYSGTAPNLIANRFLMNAALSVYFEWFIGNIYNDHINYIFQFITNPVYYG